MAYLEKIDLAAAEDLGVCNLRDDLTSTVDGLNFRPAPVARCMTRIIVHVIAAGQDDRASLARMIFSAGHHAEIYSDARELISHRPSNGVVIVDDSGAGRIVGLMDAMTEAGIWLPVIGFGKHLDIDAIIAGIKAGVTDYFVADAETSVILQKLETAYLSGQTLRESRSRQAHARLLFNNLSAREREVIDLLAEGHSNKEMARILSISPRTVEIHRMKMMSKLCARTSAEAIRMKLDAFRDG